MGEVLNNGVYLPDRGERNAYDGLKGNWNTLDSIAGKVPGYDAHISDTDIHVTAADKQTWNGKADASHVHNANDVTTGVFDAARIPNLDASKITTGTIDIDRLPQGALERLVKVADQAARYALTASDVQLGDTVQQLDTGVMYVVTDETKLDSADGYTEYTAGSATSVPWSGVTGKPADYPPASHSHGNITNDGKVGTTADKPLITGTGGVVQAGSFGTAANTFCEGNDSRLSDARTPIAHTHTKSDVTNLFNSANSWTENNTYSKTVVIERSTDTGNFLALKNSVAELGSTPASATSVTIAYRDKNDENLGYMGVYYDTDGSNHFRLYVRNKFTSGSPSTSGTADYAYFGLKLNADKSKEGILKASFRPYDNNAYDLGSSSYQWNNLYAKNYYYNGTAWGLDKENTWTQNQIIASNYDKNYCIKDTAYELGQSYPNGEHLGGLIIYDKNSSVVGLIDIVDRSYGSTEMRIRVQQKFDPDSNNRSTSGTTLWNETTFGIASDKTNYVRLAGNLIGPNYNLGTSTNKWKSLNGVNPGALSIPNKDNKVDITSEFTDLTGGNNFYIPPADGFVSINADTEVYCAVVSSTHNTTFWRQSAVTTTTGYASVTIPVRAGLHLLAKIKSTGAIYAEFYPCLGNV